MKPPQLPQATLANWREAPYNRWAFHHVRELATWRGSASG
jgi:hypothetical protein